MHAFAVGRLCHPVSTPGQQTDGRTDGCCTCCGVPPSLPPTYVPHMAYENGSKGMDGRTEHVSTTPPPVFEGGLSFGGIRP